MAIVTGGGGSGVGHGISMELARAGATVVIAEVDLPAVEQVQTYVKRFGGKAGVHRADVSQAKNVEGLIEHIIRDHGRLDILVKNAGVGLIRPVADSTEEEFNRLMGIDLLRTWLCCKFAIPYMRRRKQGPIVHIASVHGRATDAGFGHYSATKAIVGGLMRGITVQYGIEGIRANTISPGLADGQQTRDVVVNFTNDVEGWLQHFVHRCQVLPRIIQPDDFGRVAVQLASNDSRSITGVDIPVDAGELVQPSSRGSE